MKKARLLLIVLIVAAVFLSVLGYKLVDKRSKSDLYPASEQIAARFIDTGTALEKADATPAFIIDANYETYTDGKYNYFVDTDNHLVRLIEQINSLPPSGTSLNEHDLEKIAAELFRKAYGYNLTGDLAIVNYGEMGDAASPVRIDTVEKIDKVETGNKGVIFLHPDGSISGATFLPGLKPDQLDSIDKAKMISEEAAKELALEAVREQTNSALVKIIESEDTPYSAKIQSFKGTSFWSIEFLAGYLDNSGKEQQAFFGVQLEAFTGRVLIVHSSLN